METDEANPAKALWAPWRVEYFSAAPQPDFLLAAARAGEDREHLVLLRRRHCFLMLNRYPYAVGHLMAVPYRKVAATADLSEGERLELWDLADIGQRLLRQAVGAEGFNLGLNLGKCAGAGVADHLHLHIVPRRSGDHNFMPVLGGVHVHSEAMEAVYDKLTSILTHIGQREEKEGLGSGV
jgi:ATP adenylyltransferase